MFTLSLFLPPVLLLGFFLNPLSYFPKAFISAGFCLQELFVLLLGELEVVRGAVASQLTGNAPPPLRGKKMGSTEEPDRKKRPAINNHAASPPAKKQTVATTSDDRKVDPGMLQYQNQKLSQQLEVQKVEIHELEERFAQLRDKQAKYDETLMMVNRAWNELVEDLELLASRPSLGANGVRNQELSNHSEVSCPKSVPPDQTFLYRLLQAGALDSSDGTGNFDSSEAHIDATLAARRNATAKILTRVVQSIELQRQRNEELTLCLKKAIPSTEETQLIWKKEEDMRLELEATRTAMDALHVRHRTIMAENAELRDGRAADQCELRKLKDKVDDLGAELEACRRKLVALKQQKEGANTTSMPGLPATPVKMEPGVNGVSEKELNRGVKELQTALEDAQKLAARRLAELEEAHHAQLNLTQQFRQLQAEGSDEQGVQTSRPYIALNEQMIFLRQEVERYRLAVEQAQRERDMISMREKESMFKAEAGEAAGRACQLAEARAHDLEAKLQQCMVERDSLQRRLEEAHQVAGRKETVSELKVMVSTLHKEMNMMHTSLNKYKEAAQEAHGLRAEAQSLSAILQRKEREIDELQKKRNVQEAELKYVKDEMKLLRESEQELKLFLEMFECESTDPRDVMEIKQAECRALALVERMKLALDEHSLALRVKAANEAESACQQRLATAEADIAQLRQKLDESDRLAIELKESLQSKNEEGEAYISEIETIGQAYEDMQAQNRRLLHQITERDDYNTQLMSESVKAKQLQASLLAEKEALSSRMQHAAAAGDVLKNRLARLDDQAKSYMEQLGKSSEECRQHQSALDLAKRKQQEAEREAQSAKAALEGAQAQLEERNRRIAEADAELEKERFKRKRAEEESETQSLKLARRGVHHEKGGSSVEELQEEIKEYKSILKCSVCHDRPKEVVITKCFHLFCSPCIQRNLEIRHRKCPGCGVPFGHSDVRNVYI